MRIIIPEFMDDAAVASLMSRFDVLFDKELVKRRDDLLNALVDADAIIVRNATQVDTQLLGAAPLLKAVGRLGVGLDNIDTQACAARGVEIIPATGANASSVAEYVIATAMLLLRGAYQSSAAVAVGEWPRSRLSNGREIAGKTLGLVGFGSIGKVTGRLGRALGMRVIGFDPNIPMESPVWSFEQTVPRSLDEVAREADIVSLHVPLTPQTRELLDAGRIGRMKHDAILINTARGGIVDEAAVAAALRAGRLGGAALDVFQHEPLATGSPLCDCPNLVLTPHIAGVTRESNVRVSSLIAEKITSFLDAR